MEKNRRRRNLMLAETGKKQLTQQLCLSRDKNHHPPHYHRTGNLKGWFQLRKRASQRLRNLSYGNLVIVENGYRGDCEQHWLQDLRCEHVFRASIKQAVAVSPDRLCPFCHGATDMERYGSIEAVQEHVNRITNGLIRFCTDNHFATSGDKYKFICTIHKTILETSFDNFLKNDGAICKICNFERRS